MAELIIDTPKLIKNIKKLNDYLLANEIEWTLITKVLCGNKNVLEKILKSPESKRLHSIGDSRLSNLKKIKNIKPDIVTLYIKPPAIQNVKKVIQFADISLNSSLETIIALDEEAGNNKKKHRVVIMIEMGELREGVIRENVIQFYQKVFDLPNIIIEGIGTNLGCMYGIEPTYDKLIQLCLYKQLLEAKFDRQLKLISGGSSITLPLIPKHKIPVSVNHFRIGEAAFLGTSPLNNKKFRNLSTKAFEYDANIIEMAEKETTPDGKLSEANVGQIAKKQINERKHYRAITDFGIIDVDIDQIKPKDKEVKFAGTTSDMTVFDIGSNLSKSKKIKYEVGKRIRFEPSYMAVARLLNSKFIDIKVK